MDKQRIGHQEPRLRAGAPLGDRALWGSVGYSGRAFAPAPDTYLGVDGLQLSLTTVPDSGRIPRSGAGLANLYPLLAAAMYEAGFAQELGPLSTWRN